HCPNSFDPKIRDSIWSLILDGDDLGSTWGKAGVNRAPGLGPAGWNDALLAQVTVPSLIIRGALDTTSTAVEAQKIYNDIGSTDKVLVTVTCGTHQLLWERKHMVLFEASLDWLASGTYNGQSSGSFVVP